MKSFEIWISDDKILIQGSKKTHKIQSLAEDNFLICIQNRLDFDLCFVLKNRFPLENKRILYDK